MAYSKAKLKNNDDETSHCFKTFLIRIFSGKFLPTQTVL